jgi:Right handed beta helix region
MPASGRRWLPPSSAAIPRTARFHVVVAAVAVSSAVAVSAMGSPPPASAMGSPPPASAIGSPPATPASADNDASSANATTFYVDSATGDDADRGTSPGAAWASIDRVNTQDLNPGDRVLFRGGQTFDGTVSLDATDAGTSRRPVVIASYGHGRATIAAGPARGIVVFNAAGIEIRNLRVTGTSSGSGDLVNGIDLFTDLPGATKLEHIRIDRVDVSGFRGAGILLSAWPDDGTKSGFKDVRITRVDAHGNDDAGIASYGYWDTESTTWAHEDVYVGHSRMYGNRGVAGKGGHSGNGLVLGDVNRALVERNVAHDNGADNDYPGGGPVGIWTWDSNRVVIQYNESYANKSKTLDGDGLDLDGGVTNSVLQYNYTHDNYGAGILLAQFTGARPFHGNVVRYNISENDSREFAYGGILLWNGGSGITDTVIHHNTIVADADVSPQSAGIRFWSETSTTFYDNILATGDLPQVDVLPGLQSGAVFQGNNYWSGEPGKILIGWGGENFTTLGAWRTATGQEKADERPLGTAFDPMLTAPGRGGTIGDADRLWTLDEYELRPGSPLRDLGYTPSGFEPGPRDFFGTRLPQGRVLDVGAHELRRHR